MAVEIKRYTINPERMKRGATTGFEVDAQGLVLDNGGESGMFFSGRFDSTVSLNEWGRLRIFMELPEQCSYSLSVYISNENEITYRGETMSVDSFLHSESVTPFQKLAMFTGENTLCCKNLPDMLLYGVQGRYLWFAIEMYSPARCLIKGGELFTPGDAFEEYLPQIYQSDGFFRRYMSVISSMHLDLERRVEQYPRLLDIDVAADEMLPMLADWIGLSEICKFVSGATLRKFLREGFWLNRNRGTIGCISRVVELFTGSKPIIVERYRFFEHPTPYSQIFSRLYGSDNNCFTVIIFDGLAQEDYLRIKYLIELFAPVKATARIVIAQDMIFMDSCIYMDKNARLAGQTGCVLGTNQKLDSNIVLS